GTTRHRTWEWVRDTWPTLRPICGAALAETAARPFAARGVMKPYPNLRHVRLFCHCLQFGSLTRAADLVGISQPAASQALKRLEMVFGAPLVDFRNAIPVATEEGRIVLVRAQR